jgi:nucleotide-binding universal stress UspA family protein
LAAHRRTPSAAEPLLALGLLGHVDALDPLLAALDHEAVAWAAAEALELLTGAGLYEQVLEPVPAGGAKAAEPDQTPTEPDEPIPEELAEDAAMPAPAAGAEPPVEDDEPAGEPEPEGSAEDEDEDDGILVLRPSRSRERWSAWLAERSGTFAARQLRHRHGAPFLPARSLDALASTHPSSVMQELVACELAIRHGAPLVWSPRLLVPQQREALRRIRAHLDGQRVVAGAWVKK